MSTPFLIHFSAGLVARLLKDESMEIDEGTSEQVAGYLANYLASSPSHSSLISRVAEGLLECPQVQELYADNEKLKALIESLDGR